MAALVSINPIDNQVVSMYDEMPWVETAVLLEKSHQAFLLWREKSFCDRAGILKQVAAALRAKKHAFAQLMALEMGKPVTQGRAEIDKCALTCEYYAENAALFLKPETIGTDAAKSFVTYQPLGTILGIMPWNFPFWQVFRFAAPTLMAGNSIVLKHASNVTGCSIAIETLFSEAGLPPTLFQALRVGSKNLGPVIAHPAIQAVTLTGSTPAGRSVAALAGQHLKKTVLELGGSDPYVVLSDAPLKETAAICAQARLINGGQSCIAAKRFILAPDIADEFTVLLKEEFNRVRMGNPLDDGVQLGPMARIDLRDELHQQVLKSCELGACLALGGEIPTQCGAFYPPTILTGVQPGMPAYQEELFGPVASIIVAEDEDAAIRIANDSEFGLGAAVFTRDVQKGEFIAAERLEAGACFVNTFVRSDPRLPFGGVKLSGYGRELSYFGIREFVNVKTVYIR